MAASAISSASRPTIRLVKRSSLSLYDWTAAPDPLCSALPGFGARLTLSQVRPPGSAWLGADRPDAGGVEQRHQRVEVRVAGLGIDDRPPSAGDLDPGAGRRVGHPARHLPDAPARPRQHPLATAGPAGSGNALERLADRLELGPIELDPDRVSRSVALVELGGPALEQGQTLVHRRRTAGDPVADEDVGIRRHASPSRRP